jgi:hypothetical protein
MPGICDQERERTIASVAFAESAYVIRCDMPKGNVSVIALLVSTHKTGLRGPLNPHRYYVALPAGLMVCLLIADEVSTGLGEDSEGFMEWL